jgi:hypothetical protein
MKKSIIAAIVIVFALSSSSNAKTDYAKVVGGYFYTSLSHYGTWIDIGFGSPVWRPTVMRKTWQPYYQGQWIYTNYGWYWDSSEPFGDIVYHYGRWYYDDYYGWIWIPDYQWAPAWVEWRYNDDYIGWAPLSPYATFSISVGIYFTHDYQVHYPYWNFVKYSHFCDQNVYNYYVAPKYRYRVYERTKTRLNYSYYDGRVRNDGVDYDRIREKSGRTIEKRNLVGINDPNELSRDRNNGNNDKKEIRTYIANREDISRDGLRDIKVERNDRKSSLDYSKVEIGRDRNLNQTIQKDKSRDEISGIRNPITNRDNGRVEEKVIIDNNRQKVDNRAELQRKLSEEMKKRSDANIQKSEKSKSSSEIKKQNTEQRSVNKTNTSTNKNRNTDIKRNETKDRNDKIDDNKKVDETNRNRTK